MNHDGPGLRDAVQPLLAVLPRAAWLPHKLIRKPDGSLDKPPCQGARTNAPTTWFTFDAALALLMGPNDVAGIGFAITRGVITLDFDHCRDPASGELADEVAAEVERLDSYAYVTPSRTGIRVVGLNDTATPIPGGKSVRWLPGGHKMEIFIGPANFYNTFTADLLPGQRDTLRDISGDVLDYLASLDGGRAEGKNGADGHAASPISNPNPQRSMAAIVAALNVIPNNQQDWEAWNRIGMAVWRSSGGTGAGLDAWRDWSVRHPSYGGSDNCEARWQNYFDSPPTRIGFGTLYYEARQHNPLFVAPFDPAPNETEGDGRATDGDLPFETAPAKPLILTMRQLDALPPPEWLVEGLVPEKSLVVAFGPPKAFKSFLVLSLALHVAEDRPWFGHAVKQGAVVYIAGEGTGGLSTRLRAMRTAHGISIDAPLYIIRRAVNFRDHNAVTALAKLIRETVGEGVPIRMVVVDTLARAMPGADENSAQEVGLVIAECDWLKDELDTTAFLVHHSGKDETKGARGTSALRGAWDTAFEIRSAGRARAVMTVVDQKEAEAGQRMVFRMDEVAAGIGRTSLVPVLDETPDPDMPGQKPDREVSGHAGLVLQALRDIMAGPESAILPPFDGLPQGDARGVPVEALRRKVYERMPAVSQEARQKAFVRSVQNLLRLRAIGVRDPWVWLV